MKPHRLLPLIPALFGAFLLIGCPGKYHPNAIPPENDSVFIELIPAGCSISGYQSNIFYAPLFVSVYFASDYDTLCSPIPNLPITLSVVDPKDWKGVVTPLTPQDTITDSTGEATWIYRVVLSRSGDLTIRAIAGDGENTIWASLEVIGNAPNLSLEAEPSVILVAPDTIAQVEITATCLDSAGLGIKRLLCRFSTDPDSLGVVSPDSAITDSNGRAKTTFSTIRDRYGACTVTVAVGDSVAIAQIEIVEKSKPAYSEFIFGDWNYPQPPDSDATVDIFVLVLDDRRVLLPDVPVEMWLAEFVPESGTFGRIVCHDSTDSTDNNGSIWFTFHTDGGYGKEYIVVRAGEGDEAIEDSLLFPVSRPHQPFGRLSVFAEPSSLSISIDTLGRAMIFARLQDSSGIGIPDWMVEFWTDLGWLAHRTLTDSNGTATAEYYVWPRMDFPPDSTEMTATITATIPNSSLSDTVQVRVLRVE